MAATPAGSGGNNGEALENTPPGTKLAGMLLAAAGPGRRYAGLGESQVMAAARRWSDIESWAYGQKLAAVREMIRRNPLAGHGAKQPGGLPRLWQATLIDEVALALQVSQRFADKLVALAWTLEARLPLTCAALDAGILDASLARLVADETSVLSDEDAHRVEAMVAGWWAGKTWTQLQKKLAAAVINVDPDAARRRREAGQREARVTLWRERTGTTGLSATGLPTDRALMADRAVQERAKAYKRWGIPEPMSLLRVRAFLDLLTQTDSRADFPKGAPAGSDQDGAGGPASQDGRPGDNAGDGDSAPEAGAPENDGDGEPESDRDVPDDDGPNDADGDGDAGDGDAGDGDAEDGDAEDGEDDGDSGGPGGGSGPDGGDDGPVGPSPGSLGLPVNLDFAIPLLDLLGLTRRAGEARNLGVLDPDLARDLVAAAARDPRSTFGIIVTDAEGHAIGYARATRRRRPGAAAPPGPGPQGTLWPEPSETRPDNYTVTFSPAGPPPAGGYGDSAGYGTWILTIGDLELTVTIDPIPAGGECDHRFETKGYRPSARLRRLVQVRDGECVMPVCARHPKGTDFEHAIPWPEGRTCACNGSCRCRHDHIVKQSKGWKVRQLPGGVHEWTTPSGRKYRKGPREYPI